MGEELSEEAKYYSSDKFKLYLQQQVVKDTWDKGLPMVYLDDKGRIVKHWKDGKIEVVKNKVLPCASKVKFATEKDALFSLKKITKTSDRKVIPIRVYECNHCGNWHLTSKTDRFEDQVAPFKAEIEALKLKISEQQKTIEGLTKRNNKEENIAVKVDKRVKEMQLQVGKLTLTVKRLREDNSELINKYHTKKDDGHLDKS